MAFFCCCWSLSLDGRICLSMNFLTSSWYSSGWRWNIPTWGGWSHALRLTCRNLSFLYLVIRKVALTHCQPLFLPWLSASFNTFKWYHRVIKREKKHCWSINNCIIKLASCCQVMFSWHILVFHMKTKKNITKNKVE